MTTQTGKRIAIWTGVTIGLGLMVWGLAQLAVPPGASEAGSSLAEPVNGSDHVRGSTIAKVTMVEYSDFQCPACGAFEPEVQSLESKYGTQVLFVYRHFPLPQHQNADLAARAAEAAANQNKFWEMHDKLFATQNDWSVLSNSDALKKFTEFATALGLDIAKFTADVNGSATADRVQHDVASGEKSGVDSTPSFYINGTKVTDMQTYGDLETALSAALNQNK